MAQKIKKGDTVIVLSGKEKGKKGKVLRILRDEHKVLVDGINTVTRHTKNRRVRSKGQVIEKQMPVHISKVSLLEGDKPVRAGFTFEGEGKDRKKVRVARPSGKQL